MLQDVINMRRITYSPQQSLPTYFIFQVSVTRASDTRTRQDTEPERRFRGKSGDLDVVGENGEYISLGMAPIRPINAGIPES